MAINKVEYGGNTLIDLTSDSVTPESLLSGVTAHDKSGNPITGTFDSDKYLEKTGDASNATVTFTQATSRANISSKEKFSVIMGKIAKFFSDLKTVAFTGKYSDLSGTPGVVSKTANGLCPKNGGTTTKFLRDDGTYAEPTASVSGLSTLEQVTAAATAGNVTDPVGAGAVNELNSSLGVDIKLIDGVPYWSERGADTWNPFKPTITDYVNWINSLVPLIPKQTDNSNIIGNSINVTSYKGFQAFDEDDYTMWISRSSKNVSTTNPHWIGYKFSEPTSINLIKIIGNATTIPATIQGSNDGSTWTDIETINNVGKTTIYHALESNSDEFLYFRALFTTYNARWVQSDAVGGPKTFYYVALYTIQFYNT